MIFVIIALIVIAIVLIATNIRIIPQYTQQLLNGSVHIVKLGKLEFILKFHLLIELQQRFL